eukprot:gene7196-2681_t
MTDIQACDTCVPSQATFLFWICKKLEDDLMDEGLDAGVIPSGEKK